LPSQATISVLGEVIHRSRRLRARLRGCSQPARAGRRRTSGRGDAATVAFFVELGLERHHTGRTSETTNLLGRRIQARAHGELRAARGGGIVGTSPPRSPLPVPPKSGSCRAVGRVGRPSPIHLPYPAREHTSQLRTRARVEPESHERADRHSHIFVETAPNRTTLMFSRITLNFSRVGHFLELTREINQPAPPGNSSL
jgi:hypothetical protein